MKMSRSDVPFPESLPCRALGDAASLARHAEVLDVSDIEPVAHIDWVALRKRPESVEDTCATWFDALPQSLRAAVAGRQYEYILGRLAVAVLVKARGLDACWLRRIGRRPAWPDAMPGSISHSDTLVVAAIASRRGDQISLGIDVESLEQPYDAADALATCFIATELRLLADVPEGMVVGFAAKEALFKAVNPLTDVFFEFNDAAVIGIDAAAGSLDLQLLEDVGPKFLAGRVLNARWRLFEEHVLAIVEIRDPDWDSRQR